MDDLSKSFKMRPAIAMSRKHVYILFMIDNLDKSFKIL